MQIKPFARCLALLIAPSIFFMLSGCTGDNDSQNTSTVQGTVAQVMTAMEEQETAPTQMARWKDFLSFVATAHAQGTDLSGITVIAQLNGVTLDTTVTDAAGDFTLNVFGGDLTLTFSTDVYELILTLTVTGSSNVSLIVSLHPGDTDTPVVVEQMGVTYQPIDCTTDTMTLSGSSPYVIDGGGDTCIHATGKCAIDTAFDESVDIQLINCGHCIRAEGRAAIHLITEGSVTCEHALEDGIHTRGRAEIEVQAGDKIIVSAAEDGIDASGNSSVHLSLMADDQVVDPIDDQADDQVDDQAPDTPISITGGAAGINAQGNATVDIAGACTVEGTAEHLAQSGNASVMTTCDL
jgi:hypothetical protein